MNKLFHIRNLRIKVLFWIIIIVIIILGINRIGTHSIHQTNSVNQNNGIAKTHDTQVGQPSKKYIQHENHHSQYNGHLKDLPGNDNNPKKG